MRRMISAKSEIHQPGLFRGDLTGVADVLDSLVHKVFRQVIALLRPIRWLTKMVIFHDVRVPLVGLATEKSVVTFEATASGPGTPRCSHVLFGFRRQMPLSDAERAIAFFDQHLRDGSVFRWNHCIRSRKTVGAFCDARHPIHVRISACEETRASWRTQSRRVPV